MRKENLWRQTGKSDYEIAQQYLELWVDAAQELLKPSKGQPNGKKGLYYDFVETTAQAGSAVFANGNAIWPKVWGVVRDQSPTATRVGRTTQSSEDFEKYFLTRVLSVQNLLEMARLASVQSPGNKFKPIGYRDELSLDQKVVAENLLLSSSGLNYSMRELVGNVLLPWAQATNAPHASEITISALSDKRMRLIGARGLHI